MIHVIATLEIHSGKRDAFLREFHELVPKVKAEKGCLEYGPTVDIQTSISGQMLEGENTVVILEKWESVAALEAHFKEPHMVEFLGKAKELVSGLQLKVLQPA